MNLRKRFRTLLDAGEKALASQSTRIVLSIFILVSVLPDAAQKTLFHEALLQRLDPFFLSVFSLELGLRLALFVRSWRRREARRAESLMLVLDAVAVASFLPLQMSIGSPALRLLRLFRLLLLVGYWGRQARELLAIVTGPERRYQVVAVIFLAFMVSLIGALLVDQMAPAYDFNADGGVDERDHGFFRTLWWSFRQVQDSGNLVAEIDRPSIVALSLLLTLAGVFVFSVIIGIGTGAIEELLERVRDQPVSSSDHTVILGLTGYSVFLLDELAKIYRKNLGSFRGAVLGQDPKAPSFLHRPELRSVQYRRGNPVDVDDLDRVNVRQANRVLILGVEPEDPDGGVIATILAVREHNAEVDIYPDVEHERNFPAMRSAGGRRTHLVGSGSFLGYYIAQNVIYPGIYRLHRHILTSAGCEVYTYLFSAAERQRLMEGTDVASFDPRSLQDVAFREYGVSLIGLFVARDPEKDLEDEDLEVLLNPPAASGDSGWGWLCENGRISWAAVRGLIGVTLRWKDLRQLGEDLVKGGLLGSGEIQPTEESLPLILRPARPHLQRVLICGDSIRVPRVVTELFHCFPALDVTVAATDANRCRQLARQIEDGLAEVWGNPPAVTVEGDRFEIRAGDPAGARGTGRVLLLLADWADDRSLQQQKAVSVVTADAILLLPGLALGNDGKQDLDGRVALDCLHTANLVRDAEIAPRPGLHVLGYVRDPIKGDLLERRFARITDGDGQPRFTIVSSERARNHFIMQNVFVRGLNSIYLELMGAEGQHLARLKPSDADGRPLKGTFHPSRLAGELLAERRTILLGYETETEDGDRHVELDPRQMQACPGIPWTSVRALYVLGSG